MCSGALGPHVGTHGIPGWGPMGSHGGKPMGSHWGGPMGSQGGDLWAFGNRLAIGTHGPMGPWGPEPLETHWPLGTQALGDPLALGDPGPWARIFNMRVNTSINGKK